MAGTAQGTVDSLLGRLSSVLIDEAQLLGGVRGDVRFIKDEMEIMNGFLLDLANANPNNQLRAWIKQVRELANDSQNCVDRYVQSLASRHSAGILGSLQRVAQLVRTMPTRHRIAVQIQELKARAREVGERRLRYGIIVPHVTEDKDKAPTGPKEEEEEEDDAAAERRAQADVSEFFKCEEREVIGWLTETLGDAHPQRWLRVIAVIRRLSQEKEYSLARRVHDHPCASSWFDFRTCIDRIEKDTPRKLLLQHILEKLPAVVGEEAPIDTLHEELLLKKLEGRLKGKKFLIVAADDPFGLVRKEIESACRSLPNGDRSPGSAIIVGAGEPPETDVYKSKNYLYLDDTFCGKAVDLAGEHGRHQVGIMQQILRKCNGSLFCMEMFLRALYVNPNMTKKELENLRDELVVLVPSRRWKFRKQLAIMVNATIMTKLFYKDLPSQYKRCLLYLSIFPEATSIKRASLVRRWAAQGLITERDGMSATDEAERCFKALVARGLVCPAEIGAAGKVRTCTVPTQVHFVITMMARDGGLVDRDLSPDLACRLSIWDRVKLQQLTDKDANAAEHSNTCWNIRKRPTPIDSKGSKVPLDATVTFLESLTTSSPSGLVKVLDLEGCKGLEGHHLKNICNQKTFQLRYLSLRNTDVEKLPKDIDKLQHLETLDIRQTKIDASAPKPTLPTKLKHLLAGCTNCPSKDAIRSKEAFSTVYMPHGIRYMTKLQILSHVNVSKNVNELMDVGKLKQLRKLGVVLHGKEDHIKSLLQAIEMLSECLRSLSVRIEPPAPENNYEKQNLNLGKPAFLPPKSLESLNLNITGGITGLPTWIKELHQLSKITLCGTDLKNGDLLVLAALHCLRCLRLRDNSYTEDKLTFKDGEFKSLKYLVVEVSTISTIQFENGAVPKLEKIVWAFTEMKTLSGLENLNNLKEIELIGKCDTWRHIIEEMAAHPNHPAVTHHPIREAAATSNTSIQEC